VHRSQVLIRRLRPLLLLLCIAVGVCAQQGADAFPTSADVLGFLNQVVDWRRGMIAANDLADEPGDLVYTADNEAAADQIAQIAFDYGRAQAALITPAPQPDQNDSASPTSATAKNLQQWQQNAEKQIADIRTELAAVSSQSVKNKAERDLHDAKVKELQSELALAQARLDTVRTLSTFTRSKSGKVKNSGSLPDDINALEQSVPGLVAAKSATTDNGNNGGNDNTAVKSQQASTQEAAAKAASVTADQKKNDTSGLVALIARSVALTRKGRSVDELDQSTRDLRSAVARFQAPLTAELVKTIKQANAIESAADNAKADELQLQREALDAYTASFKQLSSAIVPLGKDLFLLDTLDQRILQWRAYVKQRNRDVLRILAIRVALVLGVIIALLGFSELWKRGTFKYVHDMRRRSQFLLFRRIIVALVITFIIAFALVTEAGSLATYAGFLTAGLAVALQNVILSVVAYFFLIGRYGLHVGDRVTLSGITGDVFDIGLVRLHLIELAGTDNDMHPTGRSVVFSNSVILQPATSLFKLLPGSDFIWHEVTLSMSPSSDYSSIEKRLLAAVEGIYQTYKGRLRFTDPRNEGRRLNWSEPKPSSRLRLTDGGLELVIRYPVLLDSAGQIDDQVTRVILDAIAAETHVRLVPSTSPNLQMFEPPTRTT
jgi:small-conductance mechanosensitive channel